jgi:hypothetical protein
MGTPRSQAGQDRFAFAVTGRISVGTFLDIGSGEPVSCNNTCMLEESGWRGLLVDRSDCKAATLLTRKSPFLQADALTIDWPSVLASHGLGPRINYLSFDLDEDGEVALARLPWDALRFSCMTVEHDFYRFGEHARGAMRKLLAGHGYHLLCPDVVFDGYGSVEDWWVDPNVVDQSLANSFATNCPTNWSDIMSRGGA